MTAAIDRAPARDRLIALRMTEDERLRLQQAADSAQLTVSNLIRTALQAQGVPITTA